MKHVKWILILMLMMTAVVAVAQIPTGERITAQVPFTFVVADHVIPLGECTIQNVDRSGLVLAIRSPSARVNVFAAAAMKTNTKTEKAYSLVFHRYGTRYYLVAVKLEGSRVIYSLPRSNFETELLTQNVVGTEEILLASAK